MKNLNHIDIIRHKSWNKFKLANKTLTTAHLTPMLDPSASNCSAIWIANSLQKKTNIRQFTYKQNSPIHNDYRQRKKDYLVGERTQAKKACGFSSRAWSIGSEKAAVFPDPVCASPMMSFPAKALQHGKDSNFFAPNQASKTTINNLGERGGWIRLGFWTGASTPTSRRPRRARRRPRAPWNSSRRRTPPWVPEGISVLRPAEKEEVRRPAVKLTATAKEDKYRRGCIRFTEKNEGNVCPDLNGKVWDMRNFPAIMNY